MLLKAPSSLTLNSSMWCYHQKGSVWGVLVLGKHDAIQIADCLVLLSVEDMWYTVNWLSQQCVLISIEVFPQTDTGGTTAEILCPILAPSSSSSQSCGSTGEAPTDGVRMVSGPGVHDLWEEINRPGHVWQRAKQEAMWEQPTATWRIITKMTEHNSPQQYQMIQ